MGTVSKALSLLTNFNQSRTEIGLSEIARLAGVNKATAYRLLTELQAGGFVEQTGADKSWRLGPEILRLARVREAAVPMTTASRAILDRLAAAQSSQLGQLILPDVVDGPYGSLVGWWSFVVG